MPVRAPEAARSWRVSCAAIPDTLLEAELFGVRAGAFTGAGQGPSGEVRPGRRRDPAPRRGGRREPGGPGQAAPGASGAALRAARRQRQPSPADVRVIAATNRDLRAMVRRGDFREDLYYRINVVRLELPPLRRRREDIPLLAEHFVTALNCRQGRGRERLSPRGDGAARGPRLAGQRARARERDRARLRALSRVSASSRGTSPSQLQGRGARRPATSPARFTRPRPRRSARRCVATATTGAAAARELGMHRATFFRKVKALGLALPGQDGRSRRAEPGE